MNDYSRLDATFSQYKENENIIIINDYGLTLSPLTNIIEIYIIDKNNLKINKSDRNILYYETIVFKEKKKYEKLHSEIINYIKSKYSIENLYETYNGGLIYCSKKMYEILIKAAPSSQPADNSIRLSIIFRHNTSNLLFNFRIPYNKIKYWFKNNCQSLEYKINTLSIIYNEYNKEINKIESEKREIEEKLNSAKLHKEIFLQCMNDETKLLLEISKNE